MLIFGVRPNSPQTTVTTSSSIPPSCRSWIRLAIPRSSSGSCFLSGVQIEVCMFTYLLVTACEGAPSRTPPAVGEGHAPDPGLDQSAGLEELLDVLVPVE